MKYKEMQDLRTAEIVTAIDTLLVTYPITEVCELLNISKASIYVWRNGSSQITTKKYQKVKSRLADLDSTNKVDRVSVVMARIDVMQRELAKLQEVLMKV
ncbi:hypothetical protein ABE042_12160 [Viridibacillus arvi]|uniref:hypothetical protein n=1 Tax=Viridibacillus arvi TaxID=263475 RepID=UPI003D2CC79A